MPIIKLTSKIKEEVEELKEVYFKTNAYYQDFVIYI